MSNDHQENAVLTENNEHRLSSKWSLYEFRERFEKEGYKERQYKLCDVGTVEQFWAVWIHVPKPSEVFKWKNPVAGPAIIERVDEKADNTDPENPKLRRSCVNELKVFQTGIEPWREFMINDTQPNKTRSLMIASDINEDIAKFWDIMWEYLVLATIGGSLAKPGVITGVQLLDKSVVNTRGRLIAKWRLEIWFGTKDNDTIKAVHEAFKDLVVAPAKDRVLDSLSNNIKRREEFLQKTKKNELQDRGFSR